MRLSGQALTLALTGGQEHRTAVGHRSGAMNGDTWRQTPAPPIQKPAAIVR